MTDDDFRTEPVTEPPRRWRNHWLALRVMGAQFPSVAPGQQLISKAAWPTKELAEQHADNDRTQHDLDGWAEYLGAFPDET